jgi:hypothetical protein
MPPAHQAMAKRTPDKLRTEAAALGLAIGTPAFAGAGSPAGASRQGRFAVRC